MYAILSISAVEGESKTDRQQRESTALKEFFEQKTQSGEQLTEQQTANIIYELKNRGDFAGVVSVFEASKTDSPVIREFYAVALNKIGRLDESNAELESMRGEDGAKVGEISAILGKVYKLKSAELEKSGDISGAIDRMTTSVSELERGFYDTYEFYPGINLVYNRLKLAELSDDPDMINTAFNDAELVMLAAKKAGADKTSDYWTAATLLESAVLAGELSDDHIQHLIETYENDWELGATIGNLESVAETIRTFQAKPDLDDATRDRLGKIFDSITNDDGVLPKLRSAQEGAYIKTEVEPRGADTLVDYGFMYGETTTMIGGNIQFGGQLQSHVVNRFDTGVAKVLISNLELDKVGSLEDFNKIVDNMLRQQFRTDELEDLHAPTHEIYDDQIKKLLDVVGISGEIDKKMADSRTNVMVDLLLGRGDCRQHAHAKQLIFDTWKTNRLNGLFGNLREQQSSGAGTTETRTAIDELLRTQMMVFDSTIESTVKMNSLYDPAKNESGQYVVSEDFEPIEEHTWSGIVRFDSTGSVKSLEMADAFYQTEYGLGGKGQIVGNPEDYAGDGMFVTEIEAADNSGNVIKVPVRLKPAVYAGDRGKRAISHGDTGSAHLRGIDLGSDIPDVGRVIGSARIREFWEKIINPQLTKEAQT